MHSVTPPRTLKEDDNKTRGNRKDDRSRSVFVFRPLGTHVGSTSSESEDGSWFVSFLSLSRSTVPCLLSVVSRGGVLERCYRRFKTSVVGPSFDQDPTCHEVPPLRGGPSSWVTLTVDPVDRKIFGRRKIFLKSYEVEKESLQLFFLIPTTRRGVEGVMTHPRCLGSGSRRPSRTLRLYYSGGVGLSVVPPSVCPSVVFHSSGSGRHSRDSTSTSTLLLLLSLTVSLSRPYRPPPPGQMRGSVGFYS